MTFWIVVAVLSLAVAVVLALAVIRGRIRGGPGLDPDIAVYRSQLAALDRDTARGLVTAEDAERLATEIKRRILEADRSPTRRAIGPGPAALSLGVAGLCAAGVVAGSLALYHHLGAPGYPDMPIEARLEWADELRKTRPAQDLAEAQMPPMTPPEVSPEFADLMQRLRAAVAARGDDPQGFRLLARNEAAMGNFTAARAAQLHLLEILGPAATAEDHADLGDLMVLAAGGYVSPEAEAAFLAALARDPGNGTARYYLGLMHDQTGRPDLAFRYWRPLLDEGPEDAPWIAPVRAQIEEAAWRAGIKYTLPPASAAPLPGPNAADIAAAAELSVEERQQMIAGMVERLGERLASEGGTAEDWARLIRALGVLGRRDQAAAVWAEAQGVFAGSDALDLVTEAARAAGVAAVAP